MTAFVEVSAASGALASSILGGVSVATGAIYGLCTFGVGSFLAVPTYLVVGMPLKALCKACGLSETTAQTIAIVATVAAAFFLIVAVTWGIAGVMGVSMTFAAALAFNATQTALILAIATPLALIAASVEWS